MAHLISSLFDQSTQRFKDDFDFLKELASGLTGLPYCFSFAISLIFFLVLIFIFRFILLPWGFLCSCSSLTVLGAFWFPNVSISEDAALRSPAVAVH